MELNDLIHGTGEWLKGTGPSAHIVLSSRIRLARNLTLARFTNRAEKQDMDAVVEALAVAVGKIPFFKDAAFFRLNELDNVDPFLLPVLVRQHIEEHPDDEWSAGIDGGALCRRGVLDQSKVVDLGDSKHEHVKKDDKDDDFGDPHLFTCIDEVNRMSIHTVLARNNVQYSNNNTRNSHLYDSFIPCQFHLINLILLKQILFRNHIECIHKGCHHQSSYCYNCYNY